MEINNRSQSIHNYNEASLNNNINLYIYIYKYIISINMNILHINISSTLLICVERICHLEVFNFITFLHKIILNIYNK